MHDCINYWCGAHDKSTYQPNFRYALAVTVNLFLNFAVTVPKNNTAPLHLLRLDHHV